MQKLQLEQKLNHKLSGQQIQFIKLLQVPSIALNAYISKEIAANPLLDEIKEIENENDPTHLLEKKESIESFSGYPQTDLNKKYYKANEQQSSRDSWTSSPLSLQERLREQLQLLNLSEREYIIGEYLIGNLNQDGYLTYDLKIIAQDLHVIHYLEISVKEVEQTLTALQCLDPPGIGARNLQECLLLQLRQQNQADPAIQLAQSIINHCFEAFTKKHYEIIIQKLSISKLQSLKDALNHIVRLNPRPGRNHVSSEPSNDFLSPDFIITENQGKVITELIHDPIYKPRFNKKYLTMLHNYEKKTNQTAEVQHIIFFLRKRMEHAKWFMDALSQRNQTLLNTMKAIVELQYAFFVEGEDPDKLIPMVLQDVADKISMDASTVSRIVNQKSVQGRFGIYPLKFFFSKAISCSTGEDISNKSIKNKILELIHNENKEKPYTDERIGKILMQEGYKVARRTIAKYREQLNLPIARLRKELVIM